MNVLKLPSVSCLELSFIPREKLKSGTHDTVEIKGSCVFGEVEGLSSTRRIGTRNLLTGCRRISVEIRHFARHWQESKPLSMRKGNDHEPRSAVESPLEVFVPTQSHFILLRTLCSGIRFEIVTRMEKAYAT